MSTPVTIEAYPLAWPEGWKRTNPSNRYSSSYRVDFIKARDHLAKQLHLLGARSGSVVVSSNVPVRRDGLPLANQREPSDPGVACYWVVPRRVDGVWIYEQRVIACDAWRKVRENLRAVGLAVEAMRMLQRTKASEILDRAYQGFAALPPAAPLTRSWRAVMGMENTAVSGMRDVDVEVVERRFRELAKQRHPDCGGSNEALIELKQARDEAVKELSR